MKAAIGVIVNLISFSDLLIDLEISIGRRYRKMDESVLLVTEDSPVVPYKFENTHILLLMAIPLLVQYGLKQILLK